MQSLLHTKTTLKFVYMYQTSQIRCKTNRTNCQCAAKTKQNNSEIKPPPLHSDPEVVVRRSSIS